MIEVINAMFRILIMSLSLIIAGCTGIPDNIQPVKAFDADKYLGKWYEIARLDHSFERGLSNVTAEYSLLEDGGINVLNKGFSKDKNEWKDANGKAYFVRGVDEGYLKVSFFGPFYGSYIIFELDRENYQYAFVSGPDKSYLWFLSRTPQVSQKLLDHFIQKTHKLGFNTDELIFVEHNKIRE